MSATVNVTCKVESADTSGMMGKQGRGACRSWFGQGFVRLLRSIIERLFLALDALSLSLFASHCLWYLQVSVRSLELASGAAADVLCQRPT